MSDHVKKSDKKENIVRVQKDEKQKHKSSTNWASLVAEEKKEGFRK